MKKLLWRMPQLFSSRVRTVLIVSVLAGCGTVNVPAPSSSDTAPLPPVIQQTKSRWVPVRWSELPGWESDKLPDAWNAWVKSCERPGPTFAPLCADVRRLGLASDQERRNWMLQRLQAYRVEPLSASVGGPTQGLLTGYFEPVFDASRVAKPGFQVPLYRVPASLNARKPWYTRQEIDTLPEAKAALRGREIVYLADPVDALVLQIQGSGRLQVAEPDGTQRMVRVAYAASNDQPYKSVGRWLLDQGLIRDGTWPGIKAWVAKNPQRVNEMLWANPRTVFFREESLNGSDAALGPKGAQGVALTPGRSIAVDKDSIPYGTPVWLATSGPQVNLQRLVLAQDTGGDIVGAVRADYFAGTGAQAGELAGRLKQPLQLWVLWPK